MCRRTTLGAREFNKRCSVRLFSCSLCALRISDVKTVFGIPTIDGQYPRANSNELSNWLPENKLDKNDARVMIVSAVVSVLVESSFNLAMIAFKVPFLRSTLSPAYCVVALGVVGIIHRVSPNMCVEVSCYTHRLPRLLSALRVGISIRSRLP